VLDQLKQVDNRRLYQQIADQIRTLIHSGNFVAGMRLPPERELAQQLGVSRPSVREALIALEVEGSVEVRMGAGVYVCALADRPLNSTKSMGESPLELMQARSVLEGSLIVQVCALMTPDIVTALRRTVDDMRAAIAQSHPPLAQDRKFHLGIAAATGNSVLERLVGELFDERHSPISTQLSVHSESPATWTAALHEHEAILHALETRDVLGAQTAMRLHLRVSKDRWVEGNQREWN
jgi:GntR family transcriptional regulator, transcriptional repressor for pyruvate dehydrogenase complex